MNEREAIQLIATAVHGSGGMWADFGAGTGTFTRALRTMLPRGSRIYAVDSDPAAIADLRRLGDGVIPIEADFCSEFVLQDQGDASLDGMLFANALHFVRGAEGVLRHLVKLLRPGGRVAIVEYDRRASSLWVPYPLTSDRWLELAPAVGLEHPRITARRPSRYAGELYVGVADRPIVADVPGRSV